MPTAAPARAAVESFRAALALLRHASPGALARWLREHLFDHVLPFWERHALDPRGGLLTCLADDGRVLSADKWLWSQWRAVWMFSRLYNTIDRDARWLAHARHIADFCLRSGWNRERGGWALLLDPEGRVLRGPESTYVDMFAVYGLQELYKATRDETYAEAARRTADHALRQLAQPPATIPHFPYPIPHDTKPRGIPMQWSLALAELGATLDDARYRAEAVRFSEEIFRDFHDRERNAILEFVRPNGGRLDTPTGRVVIPGHTVEDMWFQAHVFDLTGRETIPRRDLFRLMLRHLELGWDREGGGGLLLAIDIDGRAPVAWNYAGAKLWWPHTEALYGALLGWGETGQPEFLQWYERVWELCLAHYVDWQNGEWRQKLDRQLRPIADIVALPVKDPFHLPRSLILQIELLEKRGNSES